MSPAPRLPTFAEDDRRLSQTEGNVVMKRIVVGNFSPHSSIEHTVDQTTAKAAQGHIGHVDFFIAATVESTKAG